MSTPRIHQGQQAEDFVAQHLIQNDYTILARNYTVPAGEIDIIARNDDTIVFVEVKMRTKTSFDLATVVTYSKQQKIIRAAKLFLVKQALHEVCCRFDVALVEPNSQGQITLTYLPDAFRGHDW